jgi:hypothetical protein
MKVIKTFPTTDPTHVIEIIETEWGIAVRSRYQNARGGFNKSSPQLLMKDLVPVVTAAAQGDLLSPAEIAEILDALAAALRRATQTKTPPAEGAAHA